jgi:hypothetical protein
MVAAFSLLIRNGTLVDGRISRSTPRAAEVGIFWTPPS